MCIKRGRGTRSDNKNPRPSAGSISDLTSSDSEFYVPFDAAAAAGRFSTVPPAMYHINYLLTTRTRQLNAITCHLVVSPPLSLDVFITDANKTRRRRTGRANNNGVTTARTGAALSLPPVFIAQQSVFRISVKIVNYDYIRLFPPFYY